MILKLLKISLIVHKAKVQIHIKNQATNCVFLYKIKVS